jgi:hypothetical protein
MFKGRDQGTLQRFVSIISSAILKSRNTITVYSTVLFDSSKAVLEHGLSALFLFNINMSLVN